MGKKIRSIDKKALGRLQSYDWTGNVRELRNIVERYAILPSEPPRSSLSESRLHDEARRALERFDPDR